MNICQTCGTTTKNPKFCSRSCAAKMNNKEHPKRKPEGSCKVCGVPIPRRRSYCTTCNPFNVNWDKVTYAELSSKYSYQKNSRIRTLARNKMLKSKIPQKCHNCGYDKHVHVSHIRDISDFPNTASINKINSFDNLLFLCPNCHWEFDNNLLIL